jgi:hypothetical protein
VVTIPYLGATPVAITSHFYEFRDLDSGRVSPSWELVDGQRVQPLLTTGSGLIRYALRDSLRVVGKFASTPCLQFEGRLDGVDLVGEKISPELAMEVLRKFEARSGYRALTLIASEGDRSYRALVEGEQLPPFERLRLDEILEKELAEVMHYRLARELGQLAPAKVELSPNPLRNYEAWAIRSGMVQGNIKVEPLILERSRSAHESSE